MCAMTARGSRGVGLAAVVAALAVALTAAPAWGAPGGATPRANQLTAVRLGPIRSGNGIVQAVRPHVVVVRQLDGSILLVPVGPRTVVLVNGVRSGLAAIQPGFVLAFKGRPGRPALELRASGSSGSTSGTKP